MTKILFGCDDVVTARQAVPDLVHSEIEFVDKLESVIRRAMSQEFDIVVTELDFTPDGQEGLIVLKALTGTPVRRILWTGEVRNPAIRAKAMDFGAEVLDKDELGTLAGLAVSEAPLKSDGLVLVFVSDLVSRPSISLRKVIGSLFNPEQVVVSANLFDELMSGLYGLVIDTTTLDSYAGFPHGRVAFEMQFLKLPVVPRVVCLKRPRFLIEDIAKVISRFLAAQGKLELFG